MAARPFMTFRYDGIMDKREHLERHLELCKRVYERMKREGSWPWSDADDSSDAPDMVESEDS